MKTIKRSFVNEIVIQKSRFIGLIRPINSCSEVKDILLAIRKEYPKATHYCYGYVVDGQCKSNDDGEPSSTAGKPILEVLLKNGLTGVLLVVVRYFGGIKLGAGGLTRAYVDSASQVIGVSDLFDIVETSIYRVRVSYSVFDVLKRYLSLNGIVVLSIDYLDEVELIVSSSNLDIDEIRQFMQDKIGIVYLKDDIVLVPSKL